MQRQNAVERNKKPIGTLDIPNDFRMYYLNKNDKQMRFNNAKDPIYHVFASIERRPLSELFKGFIRETYMDTLKFVKKLAA